MSAIDPPSVPSQSAAATLALAESVATQAAGVKVLPAAVKSSLGEVDAGKQLLAAAIQAGPAEAPRRGGKDARERDRAMDQSCRCLYHFLFAWSLSGDKMVAGPAQAALDALFPNGLGFIQDAWAEEFMATRHLIDTMHAQKLDAVIGGLGGGSIVKQLIDDHVAYGKALHITGRAPATPERPAIGVQEARRTTEAALRKFAVVVSAHVDDQNPATRKLAATLLAPIRATPPRRRAARPVAPAPQPQT